MLSVLAHAIAREPISYDVRQALLTTLTTRKESEGRRSAERRIQPGRAWQARQRA